MNRYLPAGEIVNTHGIRGELRVMPWADSPEFLTGFSTLYLDGEAVAVESARVQKTCVLVKLRGVDTVEAAAALRGKVLSIDREDVDLPAGTLFIDDIVGMTVTDQTSTVLGTVTDVISMPKNDVYVVSGEREYMIPAVPAYVKRMDAAAKTMEVVLIEGMATDEN